MGSRFVFEIYLKVRNTSYVFETTDMEEKGGRCEWRECDRGEWRDENNNIASMRPDKYRNIQELTSEVDYLVTEPTLSLSDTPVQPLDCVGMLGLHLCPILQLPPVQPGPNHQ